MEGAYPSAGMLNADSRHPGGGMPWPCPACPTGQGRVIGKPRVAPGAQHFIRLDYRVLRCGTCGLFYVRPPIDFTEAEWRTLYGCGYFAAPPPWFTRHRQRRLLTRLGMLEKHVTAGCADFLDVGCGEGLELEEAHRRGWKAMGLDIADNRRERVKSNPSIGFVRADLQGAHLASESQDMVYVNSVLEHVVNPRGYFAEVVRILRPGGVLYLGVPNEDGLFVRTKDGLNRLHHHRHTIRIRPFIDPYHVNGFTTRSLRECLGTVGFQLVQVATCGGVEEVLRYAPFSRGFMVNVFMLPLHVLAALIRMQSYIDVVAPKPST